MSLAPPPALSPLRHAAGRADRADWRPAVDRAHAAVALTAIGGAVLVALVLPEAGAALAGVGGALLLIGGALIGVPHGSSDFIVAHRLLRPRFGSLWLPGFLAGYLALLAIAMAAWALAPLVALVIFLGTSALHFGADAPPGSAGRSRIAFAVRATTPVLPIFLLHPDGVAGIIGALAGVPEHIVLHALLALRWPLLLPWGVALAVAALPPLLAGSRIARRGAAELLAVATAAVVLPPLLAFGLYFCLVHAPRHMAELAHAVHPRRPRAAALLVAGVVLPSALACLGALALTWDALAGALGTEAVVTWGLRAVAALTLPHMALEWMASRAPGCGPEPIP